MAYKNQGTAAGVLAQRKSAFSDQKSVQENRVDISDTNPGPPSPVNWGAVGPIINAEHGSLHQGQAGNNAGGSIGGVVPLT